MEAGEKHKQEKYECIIFMEVDSLPYLVTD
jgi:hypothetical protein